MTVKSDNQLIKIEGYIGRIFRSDKHVGIVDVLTTCHYPTKEDVISSLLNNIYEIGYHVLADENSNVPGELECDPDELRKAYEAGEPDTVAFIDYLNDWVRGGLKDIFDADGNHTGPFGTFFEGAIVGSSAYASREQIDDVQKQLT